MQEILKLAEKKFLKKEKEILSLIKKILKLAELCCIGSDEGIKNNCFIYSWYSTVYRLRKCVSVPSIFI